MRDVFQEDVTSDCWIVVYFACCVAIRGALILQIFVLCQSAIS